MLCVYFRQYSCTAGRQRRGGAGLRQRSPLHVKWKMPFIGKDWRSPGLNWTKTQHGWKKTVCCAQELQDNNRETELTKQCTDRENVVVKDVCEIATTKWKKEFNNNNTRSHMGFSNDKWVFVFPDTTKEVSSPLLILIFVFKSFCFTLCYVLYIFVTQRQTYSTLGEVLNRLDFSSAIQDLRRFNYVAKLFQLIARSQLCSLSGGAQKNYFNILEKIVKKVLEDHYNPRLVKDLLQDLSQTLHELTIHLGRSILVGNVHIWLGRLVTIKEWQQQLNNLEIPKNASTSLTFDDLPVPMQDKIICHLSDARDIINLGQTTPTLLRLSENKMLWKKLCYFHFSNKKYCGDLVLTKSDNVDWKLMYFTLRQHYPVKEHFGDTLHFCTHCCILFWKDSGHPCSAKDPESCFMPISPQHFINLFRS
ncbi:F-box only protein 25 isoform X3 [Cynoglossus semilaevis]|uniref:F-box only protein 25 isoform X3 n=1 Tax=Cynoglossus semilaevis TaxID=244447 RepID=UPI000D63158E|nr:F-box only protein 25-like isoform X3 [Cynoglossus semilaevis]